QWGSKAPNTSLPNSRPPKNWPANVSSWANPWTTSGANSSARDSQIVAQSRHKLNEAITPGGRSGGALPCPAAGIYPLTDDGYPPGGAGRSTLAVSSESVQRTLAAIHGAVLSASYQEPTRRTMPVSPFSLAANRLGSTC